ncbi:MULTISPECIES: Wzz/FepE/Etk N-terminal domain-containing protein [Thiorhodovibrio]|uniref:Wzz/FepE/Etk N-terminal domain-containing protein n=1 Tax=Thiorhodovibrio TaxID=61593 RepID=UPI001912BDE3|nr:MULTISPECIES: Wzz/FepE/Etk N-terminal domain-containing protein [Thiorhodovibrio]MBK5969437.1 hypothetical protein [Thiorhodovibrio winogradskyi]WPL11019.1 polysaccharide chain length determinant protein, PEP-CTERM locus subfamily [Thiorhodovibrio litoralis]
MSTPDQDNQPNAARQSLVASNQPALPYGLEDEIDLIEYLVAVFRNKHWILLLAFLMAGAGFGLAKVLPHRYEASVQLALRDQVNPGGVAPDERRAPQALTLVEQSFVLRNVNENYRHIVMARMRSRTFTLHFIEHRNLLPALFEKQWDAEKNAWRDDFKPDINLAVRLFREQVRTVVHNPENDLMRVYVRWSNPRLAADWANAFVHDFNDYWRERVIEESDRKRAFLLEQLRETSVVDLEKSIYRMIEAETAVEMLARARDNYVLEVLDAAVPPDYKFSPSTKRLVLMGFFGGFGLGVVGAIGSVLVRRIFKAMQAYRARTESRPLARRESGGRAGGQSGRDFDAGFGDDFGGDDTGDPGGDSMAGLRDDASDEPSGDPSIDPSRGPESGLGSDSTTGPRSGSTPGSARREPYLSDLD